ncbi:MAG: PAS domain S-box protein [Bacteroidales bacterium]|nr:PAS domain S-box protein [Bacteroidales bacterium]
MEKNRELVEIQNKIINTALLGAIVYIYPAVGASMLRILDIGWNPIYFAHIGICLAITAFFLFRNRISLHIRVHGILSLAMLASLAGIYTFKLAGGGYYMLFSIVLAVLFFGARQGIVYFLGYLITVILIYFLHKSGITHSTVDFNSYLDKETTWISNVSGHVYVSLVLIYTANLFHKYFTGSIKDLTGKKDELTRAINKLIYSEKKYRMLFEGSMDGFLYFNQESKILDCNNSLCDLLGLKRDEVLNKKYTELGVYYPLKSESEVLGKDLPTRAGSTGNLNRELIHKDGNIIPVEINIHWLEIERKIYFWAVIRSILERKNMERQIARIQIESEEKERSRYARELHDGLGPLLSTCKIYFHSLDKVKNEEKKAEHKKRAIELLDDAMRSIKLLSANISPDILRKYGLEQAIRSFCEKTSLVADIKIEIHSNFDDRLPEVVEFTVYRMLMELINNSLKYSEASGIEMFLSKVNDKLTVEYSDNGVGFNYRKVKDDPRGFGLLNLESRIRQLGGKYHYESSPGKGVKVLFSVLISET